MNLPSFDAYTLRARIVPAIIAVAPAFALVAVSIPIDKFALSQLFASLGLIVLLGVMGDLARQLGKSAEIKIEQETGRPSALRYRDGALDRTYKARCLAFLSRKIGEQAPSEEFERSNPGEADGFYVRASAWLREHTRDQQRFSVLFAENITYGMRRNLYGLKPVALFMNGLAVAISFAVLFFSPSLAWDRELGGRYASVVIVALVHATYFLLVVTKASVIAASEQYARQLALSCEVLMSDEERFASPK